LWFVIKLEIIWNNILRSLITKDLSSM